MSTRYDGSLMIAARREFDQLRHAFGAQAPTLELHARFAATDAALELLAESASPSGTLSQPPSSQAERRSGDADNSSP